MLQLAQPLASNPDVTISGGVAAVLWAEDGQPYVVLGRTEQEVLDIAEGLEVIDRTTWQQRIRAGYATLGLLVQIVSGQSYERYVEEHIFAPLQMQRSFTAEAPAREAGLAAGHRYWFGSPVAGSTPFPRGFLPAGHLISSAEDMAHYLIAQLGGGRLDSVTAYPGDLSHSTHAA